MVITTNLPYSYSVTDHIHNVELSIGKLYKGQSWDVKSSYYEDLWEEVCVFANDMDLQGLPEMREAYSRARGSGSLRRAVVFPKLYFPQCLWSCAQGFPTL